MKMGASDAKTFVGDISALLVRLRRNRTFLEIMHTARKNRHQSRRPRWRGSRKLNSIHCRRFDEAAKVKKMSSRDD
jgi:hypothetical protein